MGQGESHSKVILDYIENGKKDDIIKFSIELKDQFIDDEFDINEQNDIYAENDIVWLRPHEFDQDYLYTKDNTDLIPNNIVGYCEEVKGFITAATSLCSRLDYLKSIFLVYNPNAGCACLELCHNSKKKIVIIDDRIPCIIVEGVIYPLYGNYINGGCWLLLLLKGVAKLHGGYSYAYPKNSHTMISGAKDFLRDFTGEHCISYLTKESLNTYIKYELPKDYTSTKQFEKALNWAYYSQGKCFSSFLTHYQFHMAIISCSKLFKNELNIEIQDFSIIEVDQSNNLREIPDITTDIDLLITVRNCPIDENNSIKIYNWKDFVFNFDYVNAALLGNYKDWNSLSYISGEWKGESAGGGIYKSTWRDNPMFRVNIPKFTKGRLLVTLSLQDCRTSSIQIYPRVALTICLDDPTLNDIIAHTAYEPRRDCTIEIDIIEDVWVYDIIPSTYESGIEFNFFLTATLVKDGYERFPVEITKLENWKGFENVETFQGEWIEGVNSFGRLGTLRENTFCNPCWKMSIPFPRNVDTINFKICIILATEKKKKIPKLSSNKEYSLSLFDDNDYLYTGTYMLTPNSLKLMKQQNPDFEKGLMGRFGFSRSPITNRKEMFKMSVESKSERIDQTKGTIFKDIIIMPTNFREEEEGSFKITIMTNVPLIVSQLPQESPHHGDSLNQRYLKKKTKSIDIDKSSFLSQINIKGSGTRSVLLDTIKTSYERPKDPQLIKFEKSQRIKIWEDDDEEEEEKDDLARHPLKQYKPRKSDTFKEIFEEDWKKYWNDKK